MSKKIWRGTEYAGNTVRQKEHTRDPAYNCTVVPDAAFFPVKEAMALCKEMERMTEYGEIDRRQWAAISQHLRAVARLKKKASKK